MGYQVHQSTTEEAISANDDHPSVIKIQEAYGDNAHYFNFETVSYDCISKKAKNDQYKEGHGI